MKLKLQIPLRVLVVMILVLLGMGARGLSSKGKGISPGDKESGVGRGWACSKYSWRKKHYKLDVEPLSLASQKQITQIKYLCWIQIREKDKIGVEGGKRLDNFG